MEAIEFKTKIKNGTIQIPKKYKQRIGNNVKVIIISEQWANQPDSPVSPSLLTRMTRTLIHRGPDEEGYFVNAGKQKSWEAGNLEGWRWRGTVERMDIHHKEHRERMPICLKQEIMLSRSPAETFAMLRRIF
ncbi:MAG: hypothetical protein LWX51_18095 [Deltaproteobacteria bacterium]|jgi:hypothetical protein|nr:hypothetical protein [Deltaproteobacteria bacterium]